MILSTHWEWSGIGGLALTALLATACSTAVLAGMVFNKAKGRR